MRATKPLIVLLLGLSTVPLTATTSGVAAAPIPPPAAATVATPTPTASPTITLITGDQAIVSGENVVVRPGEGREHITFLVRQVGGQRLVIPSDAVPLLASGELDRRLFDLTQLRQLGHRAEPGELPLIVQGELPRGGHGATVVRDLPAIGGAAVRVEPAGAGAFWDRVTEGDSAATMAAGVDTIWLDGVRQPLLDESVPRVGAPAAWASGLDGTGVTVAVLDTGIDAGHPDLAGRITGRRNFTEGAEDDRDRVGHGTHVASTVAGSGAASGGRYRGVAPGAELLDGKVCVDFGCPDSWILAGMEWAAEQGAAVINMSLGGPPVPDDPLVEAVERLTDEYGVLFVAAAGNDGQAASVNSPAIADAALAVGAVDRDDQLAGFSSRGPAPDGGLKPDLTAPGVDIVAANSADGFLGLPGEPYATSSGTSMATPHVAGAAAILVQQHPDWSAARLKAALMAAASPYPGVSPFAQGGGRLDVARAIDQTVTTSPASVGFDRPLWPHPDDRPQTRTIAYRNDSPAAVTLDLAVTATGPDGQPAPGGFFTLSEPRVTVPAGGSAEVVLTADTRVGDVDGHFGGYLVATGPDGPVARTAFAVDREVESYDVTLSYTDRNGAPTGDYQTLLWGSDPFGFRILSGEPEVTLRLPAGEYYLDSFMWQEVAAGEFESTLLVQPRLVVSGERGDQTVAVDARLGRPISISAPDPAAVPIYTYVRVTFNRLHLALVQGLNTEDIYTAQLGPGDPWPGLSTVVSGGLAVPAPDGGTAASDTVYHLAWDIDGEFITGFERRARARELARVRAEHTAQMPGSVGFKAAISAAPEGGGFGLSFPMPLPHTRTEYFNTGNGRLWVSVLDEVDASGEELVVSLTAGPTSYRAGRSYRERWNLPVFGPSGSEFDVLRLGDELIVQPMLHGDGAGHAGVAPTAGSITLFRDGERVVTQPSTDALQIEVPPEPAAYRVAVESARVGSAPLSRQVSVVWEFESAHVDQETLVTVPVLGVRFDPRLGPDRTAPAGRPLLVPLSVGTATGAARVASLAVEVSFDDGETWRPAPVLAGRHLLIRHPDGDGFVSLRARAADPAGNTVEQTIVRAYAFG